MINSNSQKQKESREQIFSSNRKEIEQLRKQIFDLFNKEELKTLCFDLGVNYDGLEGSGTKVKGHELINLFHRNDRPDL